MNEMPKFRCWWLKYPRMFEVLEMRFHNEIPNHFYEEEPSVSVRFLGNQVLQHLRISEVILMQDTGFKDTEGFPIYDGDIVITQPLCMLDNHDMEKYNKTFKSKTGLIHKYGGDWSIINRIEHCLYMPSLIRCLSDSPGTYSTYVKVIGNQWQNPDLLPPIIVNRPEPISRKEQDDELRNVRRKIDAIMTGNIIDDRKE